MKPLVFESLGPFLANPILSIFRKQLARRPRQLITDSQCSIVLIPGIGTPIVESWPFCSPQWLPQCLPLETTRPRLLTFDYTFRLEGAFSWEHLWHQGDRLLKAVSFSRRGDSSRVGPFPADDERRTLIRLVAGRYSTYPVCLSQPGRRHTETGNLHC